MIISQLQYWHVVCIDITDKKMFLLNGIEY